jgi:transcription elongation GreA/GreB family factor
LVTPGAIEAALARFEKAHLGSQATMRRPPPMCEAASAEVIRPPAERDTASFGTTVTLRRDDGREQTFRIVGEDEADPAHGTVISYVSPLARAVMTCGPGDTIEIAGRKAVILDLR